MDKFMMILTINLVSNDSDIDVSRSFVLLALPFFKLFGGIRLIGHNVIIFSAKLFINVLDQMVIICTTICLTKHSIDISSQVISYFCEISPF